MRHKHSYQGRSSKEGDLKKSIDEMKRPLTSETDSLGCIVN